MGKTCQNVARQWAEFCSKPGYVMNAIGKSILMTIIRKFNALLLFWASDDEIATQANVEDLLRLYPNAKTRFIELDPRKHGYKQIGHMLMFKNPIRNYGQFWKMS